jgi:hypothetical protein
MAVDRSDDDDGMFRKMTGVDAGTLPDCWFAFRILRQEPLITISTVETGRIFLSEIASRVPELFSVKQGLHFLRTTWHFERTGVDRFSAALGNIRSMIPRGHEFVMLANYDHEANLISKTGIPAVTGNDALFTDEHIWRPGLEPVPGFGWYDAIYDARLEPLKRHELAARFGSPLLVYGHSVHGNTEKDFEAVRSLLPRAVFANHRHGNGQYALIEPGIVSRLYGHAPVALALSEAEGAMRASGQYLLAGLPVVSTPSVGGRDRYYAFPFTKVVEGEPDQIAAAAGALAGARLDRDKIRLAFLNVLAFERYNLVRAMNMAAWEMIGLKDMLADFTPLRGAMAHFRHLRHNLAEARLIASDRAA